MSENIYQNDKKLYIENYLKYKIFIDEVINIGEKNIFLWLFNVLCFLDMKI